MASRPKIALVALAALGFAALASAEAAACRIGPYDRAHYPVMSNYVRQAPSIVLARAVTAQPTDRGRHHTIYLYDFEVTEVIKGEPVSTFQLEGHKPFAPADLRVCENTDLASTAGACDAAVTNERTRLEAYAVANSAREDWPRFHFIRSNEQGGMGAVEEYFGDRIVVTCGTRMPSFEIGQTFLIFRDGGQQQFFDPQGLNHQLITRDHDAWLGAVRYFAANPDQDYLPARSLQDSLAQFGQPQIIEAGHCQTIPGNPALVASDLYDVTYDQQAYDTEIQFPVRHEEREEFVIRCQESGRFLVYPGAFDDSRPIGTPFSTLSLFPIQDGVVDFSEFAAQWQVTGIRQVALEDVLSWSEAQ